jgi:hypothetical protein
MKSSDRAVLVGVAILGLVAAFWFMVLSPKRQEASKLGTEVTELRASVAQSEQDATAGIQARKDFPTNYRHLVALGKAVPEDADTPSLLTQLQFLSQRSNVDFRSITLNQSSGLGTATAAPVPAPAPAPAPTDSTSTDTSSTTSTDTSSTTSTDTTSTTTTTTAPATETTAALMPIGAAIGPAGLPVMPYSLQFHGGFFAVADFFGRLDGMVHAGGHDVVVDGRLLTIDGFELTAGPNGFPQLNADVEASSFITPADQGLSAGATPAGPPAAATPAATTPTTPAPAVPSATVTP